MATQLNPSLLQTGAVIQVVNQMFPNLVTTNVNIPADDSIPQIGEGAQLMSLSITPKMATSLLRVDVTCVAAYNVSHGNMIVALFRDSAADAIGAVNIGGSADFAKTFGAFSVVVPSNAIASTTFSVRAGPNDGNTVTFNGTSSARKLGGKSASSITITEISA